MSTETVSVRLEQATLDRLGVIAQATGRPRAVLMTQAIEQYAETEAWQVAAIQGAADEVARGDAGLMDHAPLAAWLNSWGSSQELEPPT
ncbi:ribbon-helix-helix protein, CopG family [uncultured Thiodictyon sp.]|uniref:CopG family ribbon-helix-helix protein n=1 Tax=uncultured Thiodictyon sp. TaxID=1846217 RepID=UPI0025E491AA|nr:ribbon-helix-helix protein, CopG family [uncultured Thiodictyon sp.]